MSREFKFLAGGDGNLPVAVESSGKLKGRSHLESNGEKAIAALLAD